ncbi:MAG TPA: XisI protein [Saprospiraceae bacterium]|nr:XisI protein [Saprospiraceae bacterium]HMQ82493.1 XisI protein [Saprospiraceae bacterium]
MEKIVELQSIIRLVINHYINSLRQAPEDNIQFEAVIDDEGKHYQIIALGWEGTHRVFNLLFHLDIIKNKIWVQEDKMEQSIAEMLVEHGVSKQDIVLAYFPEYHRRLTEYAVA